MKLVFAIVLMIAVLTPSIALEPAAETKGDVRRCANRFGNALASGNASAMRSILPERGKVQVSLDQLGPEEGSFSAGQVEALFHAFLKRGKVESFELLRIDDDRAGYAMAQLRAVLVDSTTGRSRRVEVRLAMQPEGDAWVLREIRESPR